MEENVRLIFRKLRKPDIKVLLSKWGKIPTWKIDFNTTKYEVIKQICHQSQVFELTEEDSHQLQLLCVIEQPSKKTWKAFRLIYATETSLTEEHFEPIRFQRSIGQKLYPSCSCSLQVHQHKRQLWGRLSQPNTSQVLYFIHYPFSSVLLLNKGIGKLAPNFTRALKHVLGIHDIKELELESSHPDSLAQILLHNCDPEQKYTFDEGRLRPALRKDDEPIRSFCDERVSIRHLPQLRKNKKIVDSRFGDKVQPKLPFIAVKTETRFRGQKFLPSVDPSQTVHCRTKLVGPNVLEGLRKACLRGLAEPVLPRFLTSVANTGQQCLKVTEEAERRNA